MKITKYIFMFLIFAPLIPKAQSIIDLSDNTELNIGSGADVCADQQEGNGIISGPGTFCSGTLPVELISFTSEIQNRDVLLFWNTATEENNRGFEIERTVFNFQLSVFYDHWLKIGFVQGKGNSSTQQEYSFTDRNLNSGKYKYRLKQIDYNGNNQFYELSNEVNLGIPVKFELKQNYPNPFNPSTKINYSLSADSKVKLQIFDITGRSLAILLNINQTAGYYSVEFNSTTVAGGLTTGTYIYKLTAESGDQVYTAVKKMVLVK